MQKPTTRRKVPTLNNSAKIRTAQQDAKIRTQLSQMVPRAPTNKESELDVLRGRLRPRLRPKTKNKMGVPHMGGFAANLQNVRKEANMAGSFGVRTRVATGRIGEALEEEGRESNEDFDYTEEYDDSWYDLLDEVRLGQRLGQLSRDKTSIFGLDLLDLLTDFDLGPTITDVRTEGGKGVGPKEDIVVVDA